jgi:hypothetical protein
LRNNSASTLVRIPLSGNSPVPVILCKPRAVAFGDVGIYDSAKTIVQVTNTSINTLTIDSLYFLSNVFTALSQSSQVTNKDTAAITIRFKPVKFGVFTDTLFLRNNSDTSLYKIPLTGRVPSSSMAITPSSILFVTVRKDSTRQQIFTITNSSISVLQIDSFYTKMKYFYVTKIPAAGQVRIGDTVRTAIRFTPDTARSYIDTMFVANNSPLTPLKVPLSGNGTLTEAGRIEQNIPEMFLLAQNYPNPFNPSTTIHYGLPQRSIVRLVIYNILGQVVKELMNNEQQAGYYSLVWNANVSSGLYFYKLEAHSLVDPDKHFTAVKKMLLLR